MTDDTKKPLADYKVVCDNINLEVTNVKLPKLDFNAFPTGAGMKAGEELNLSGAAYGTLEVNPTPLWMLGRIREAVSRIPMDKFTVGLLDQAIRPPHHYMYSLVFVPFQLTSQFVKIMVQHYQLGTKSEITVVDNAKPIFMMYAGCPIVTNVGDEPYKGAKEDCIEIMYLNSSLLSQNLLELLCGTPAMAAINQRPPMHNPKKGPSNGEVQ